MHVIRTLSIATLALTAMACATDVDGIPQDAVRVEIDQVALMAEVEATASAIDDDVVDAMLSVSEVWTLDDLEQMGSPEPAMSPTEKGIMQCYGIDQLGWTAAPPCAQGVDTCVAYDLYNVVYVSCQAY